MRQDNLLKKFSFGVLAAVFLLVIHIGIRNFGGPIAIPITYLIWICISLFILLSGLDILKSSSFAEPQALRYLLLFVCLSLLSVAFNPILDYHSFLFKTAGLVGGFIFFISLHQFRLNAVERDKLLFVIFVSGVIEAAVGLIQYFYPAVLLPFIVHTSGHIYGSFQQPNVYASFIATALVISLFLISRPLFSSMGFYYKIAFYFTASTLSFVLMLSNSRAGIIGAVLGSALLLASRMRIYRKKQNHVLTWLIFILIGITACWSVEKIAFNRTPAIIKKVEQTRLVRNARVVMYGTAWEMFKDRPLGGHGFGNFGSRYLDYKKEFFEKFPEQRKNEEATYVSHPHNEVLYRLAESGLAGGVGMIILFSAFGYGIFKLGRERGGLYLSLLLPIGFHTQVEFPLYQSAAHLALFLFLCYLPSSYFTKDISLRLNRTLKVVFASLMAGLFIMAAMFLANTLRAHISMTAYNNVLMSQGEIRMNLLQPALNNAYLQQLAVRLLMDARLRVGLSQDNQRWIKEFVEWSKNERKATPYSALYVREAKALYALGLKKEAFDIIDEGLFLYPDKGDLMLTKTELIAEEIKLKLDEAMKSKKKKDDR
jgi:O-antigen polymerase